MMLRVLGCLGHRLLLKLPELGLLSQRDLTFNHWRSRPLDEWAGFADFPDFLTPITPEAAKTLALIVALRGLGNVSPNPLVGAVAVDREHRYLGAGAHLRIGEEHAEANLLKFLEAQKRLHLLDGGTIYVSLEPCAHHGRMPPCAGALAKLPLAKVVYGCVDPNPQVNGGGAAWLKRVGIECVHDPLWDPHCDEVADHYLWNRRFHRPMVGLKAAVSENGVIGYEGKARYWITGPRARQYAHFLRLRYDAVMIGPQTCLVDDPALNVRDLISKGLSDHGSAGRTPRRVILDPKGEVLSAVESGKKIKLFTNEGERTLLFLPKGMQASNSVVLEKLAVKSIHCELGSGRVNTSETQHFDWKEILDHLAREGIGSILIEGGPGLWTNALAAGVVDRFHILQSSAILTLENSLTWFGASELWKGSGGFHRFEFPDGNRLVEGRVHHD